MMNITKRVVAGLLAFLLAWMPCSGIYAEGETASGDKVEIETDYYTIKIPAQIAERYEWEWNTFEWTYSLQFYDKAAREAGKGYQAWRFTLMMCAYPSDVYHYPGAYVFGDVWIGDYCYAMLLLTPYDEGTPEYEAMWEDATDVIVRLNWKNDREFVWRTSFSFTDVYRQFVIGAHFVITDSIKLQDVKYLGEGDGLEEDYSVALRRIQGEIVPELLITNGASTPERRRTYVYRWEEERLKYKGTLEDRAEAGTEGESLEFWTRGSILREGWNAFLKAQGFGLYKCDDCLNFSTNILVPVPDYSAMTPYELQIVKKAQEIYDEQMQGYKSVDNYISARVVKRREDYEHVLHQAKNFEVEYGLKWNFTKLMMTCVIGYIIHDEGTIYSVFSDIMLDYAIDNSPFAGMDEMVMETVLDQMDSSIPDMTTAQFIYSQAEMGSRMISIDNLRLAMQKAESRGGKFFNAEDAAEYILLHQYNRMGFATLGMGWSYFRDAMNKPTWQTALEKLGEIALSTVVGKITKSEVISGYVEGKILDFGLSKLDGIVGQYNNERINAWRDELKAIAEETQEIFTPPVTFDIVRKNALMNDGEDSGKYLQEVPPVEEGFTFYRDFAIPENLPADAAAAYLEIAEERINLYGMEHMATYYGVYYGFKAGLSGGYFADLNQDGVPEMILAIRNGEGSYQEPTEAQYEVWTYERGNTYELFSGDLERVSPGGENEKAEYLNIWAGSQGTYLEMGYAKSMYQDIDPETMSLERWFMTYDKAGYFRRMEANPPDDQLVMRIPVAAGNRIHLANCYAFLEYLAEAASASAKGNAAAALRQTTYIGDPKNCVMSGKMAEAYAENLMAEQPLNPDSTQSSFLEAMLVDVGGDGYPFLVKTMPHPWPSFWPDGSCHFISDAMFCYFDGQKVKEYPFLEDVQTVYGWSEYPPQIHISWISSDQRGGGIAVLKVTVYGWLKGTKESAGEEIYYFAERGKLELFHRLTTVYSYPDYSYLWDGQATDDPDGCLRSAALDHDGETFLYFMNLADQNAAPGRTGITTAKMLKAYASEVPWETAEPERDYSNWATVRGTIRSVELAYLSAYGNDASSKASKAEMVSCMFEQLKNFPAGHPLHTDDDPSKSNLKRSQITAVRSGTNGSMDAIVLKLSRGRAIVIYGGTQGAQLDDIFSDAGIALNGVPIVGNAYGVLSAINPVSWFFQDQFEAASDVITKLEQEGYQTIFVTGHSLGGHLAVDVTLNHESIDECMAFDPPGRGDAWSQNTFNGDRVNKIYTYKAIGSVVSAVGTQVGRRIIDLTVEQNMAGPFPNHDIWKIAEALGGMDEVFEK